MFFPIFELIDRLAIAQLKYEKTQSNIDELTWYLDQTKNLDMDSIKLKFDSLTEIHRQIWDLEKELKSGVEHLLSLEEIGRRAIKIRNLNHSRIELKNSIADQLGCTFKEIKKDHLSE